MPNVNVCKDIESGVTTITIDPAKLEIVVKPENLNLMQVSVSGHMRQYIVNTPNGDFIIATNAPDLFFSEIVKGPDERFLKICHENRKTISDRYDTNDILSILEGEDLYV